MAGITLAQAEANLTDALEKLSFARKASYEINTPGTGRKVSQANIDSLRKEVAYWNSMVQSLSARATGRGRSRTIIVG